MTEPKSGMLLTEEEINAARCPMIENPDIGDRAFARRIEAAVLRKWAQDTAMIREDIQQAYANAGQSARSQVHVGGYIAGRQEFVNRLREAAAEAEKESND